MSLNQFIASFNNLCQKYYIDKGLEEIIYFKELGKKIIDSTKFDYYEKNDLLDNIIEAISNERQKYYEDSAENYREIYEKLKDTHYNWMLHEGFNMLKKKISQMKYKDVIENYYENKDYDTALDKFRECIDKEYMTDLYKRLCKINSTNCLYFLGKKEFSNNNYSNACELFEEALNNHTFHLTSDRTQIGREAVVRELCNAYDKLAKEYWRNDNLYYMEKSLDYYNKIHKLIYYVWPSYSQFRLYYYLYKAYNESSSSRTFNLEQVKDNKEFDVIYLYNKSKHITDLYNDISKKQNNISNLNYELNSIKNNINNIQLMIDAKNIAITTQNSDIKNLDDLADTLLKKGGDINNQVDETINKGKNQVKEIEENLIEKKGFVEEIKEMEKQKEEEIRNMKNNNGILKQKNEQLILILNSLELKLI